MYTEEIQNKNTFKIQRAFRRYLAKKARNNNSAKIIQQFVRVRQARKEDEKRKATDFLLYTPGYLINQKHKTEALLNKFFDWIKNNDIDINQRIVRRDDWVTGLADTCTPLTAIIVNVAFEAKVVERLAQTGRIHLDFAQLKDIVYIYLKGDLTQEKINKLFDNHLICQQISEVRDSSGKNILLYVIGLLEEYINDRFDSRPHHRNNDINLFKNLINTLESCGADLGTHKTTEQQGGWSASTNNESSFNLLFNAYVKLIEKEEWKKACVIGQVIIDVIQCEHAVSQTAFHLAAIRGTTDLLTQIKGSNKHTSWEKKITEKRKYYLDHAGDNTTNKLYQLVNNDLVNSEKLMDQLMKAWDEGIHQVDDNGQTPLHLAATHGHIEAVKILLERGADQSKEDHNGKTPMQLATKITDKKKRDQLLQIFMRLTPKDIKDKQEEKGGIFDSITSEGKLHCAAMEGDIDKVKVLLKQGGHKVNAVNKEGRTALQVAIINGHQQVAEYLVQFDNTDGSAVQERLNTTLSLAKENAMYPVAGAILEKRFTAAICNKKISKAYSILKERFQLATAAGDINLADEITCQRLSLCDSPAAEVKLLQDLSVWKKLKTLSKQEEEPRHERATLLLKELQREDLDIQCKQALLSSQVKKYDRNNAHYPYKSCPRKLTQPMGGMQYYTGLFTGATYCPNTEESYHLLVNEFKSTLDQVAEKKEKISIHLREQRHSSALGI